MINYWVFKSEPDCWSWQQQVQKGEIGEEWSGVRNFEARNNMLKMKLGDKGFFYHSNKERAIVGIVEISKKAHKDSTSQTEQWQCVNIKALRSFKNPISLTQIKDHPLLQHIALVKRARLSVAPIDKIAWQIICDLGN